MRIIGDIHGKVDRYQTLIEVDDHTVCVGDFSTRLHNWEYMYTKLYQNPDGIHRNWINPGNHEYWPCLMPTWPDANPASLGYYSWDVLPGVFTVGGADSIDKHQRTEGIDWFPEEEMNMNTAYSAYDLFTTKKPVVVISHDCPQSVMEKLFGYQEKSRTRQLLQTMFEVHQPSHWFFGHHHKSKEVFIDGTWFVCLAELEYIDF